MRYRHIIGVAINSSERHILYSERQNNHDLRHIDPSAGSKTSFQAYFYKNSPFSYTI